MPVNSVPSEIATAPATRRQSWIWIVIALALLAAIVAWKFWPAAATKLPAHADDTVDLSPEAFDARLLQAENSLTTLHRTQETLNQRLTDSGARTDLLRDEMLGVSQRAALLEDSVHELSSSKRDEAQSLRLDEAELLLTIAAERLQLAGDLNGAIRATALADGVLSSLRDPGLLDLRQTLAQELVAMRALPKDPRVVAAGELDALEAMLPQLAELGPARHDNDTAVPTGTGMQRLLNALVQIRPSGEQDLLSPADRSAGEAALSLEIALARTALDRGDQSGFRASLRRMDSWLRRLYADGPPLRRSRALVQQMATQPLAIDLPIAGSTLQQLRELQRQHGNAP
jgi:uroporphyrin-3 C-methyltransferase